MNKNNLYDLHQQQSTVNDTVVLLKVIFNEVNIT